MKVAPRQGPDREVAQKIFLKRKGFTTERIQITKIALPWMHSLRIITVIPSTLAVQNMICVKTRSHIAKATTETELPEMHNTSLANPSAFHSTEHPRTPC